MRVYLPEPYTSTLTGHALLVARPEARDFALGALSGASSLFQFARSHAEARKLEGRGPAYVMPTPDAHWVVRHFRRGGAVARVLEDRYLAVGVPRPVAELLASDAARRRGVDTPQVEAVVLYPAGAFYRADLATTYIPDSVDLAWALFSSASTSDQARMQACVAAGRLIGVLAARGIVHADLNAKNILLARTSHPSPRPYLLDLDRCRIVKRASDRQCSRMLRRFWRSIEKWEARTGTSLAAGERAAFEAGYRDADDAASPAAPGHAPRPAERATNPQIRGTGSATNAPADRSMHTPDAPGRPSMPPPDMPSARSRCTPDMRGGHGTAGQR